ncbi:MAG: hypothetical protein KGI38_12585 [Thaumarchaeota archaeon]|nr:hypothetical protein [Nitrososphaerota archaeon]
MISPQQREFQRTLEASSTKVIMDYLMGQLGSQASSFVSEESRYMSRAKVVKEASLGWVSSGTARITLSHELIEKLGYKKGDDIVTTAGRAVQSDRDFLNFLVTGDAGNFPYVVIHVRRDV